MKKTVTFIFLILMASTINAQTIFGKWENKNEETGKVDSTIEVYEQNGKAYAKIIDVEDESSVCTECKDERKGKKILGMDIVTGLKKDGDEWSGGEILDPRSGDVYKCILKLRGNDKLKVRGYMGASLFGRTVYWYRKK